MDEDDDDILFVSENIRTPKNKAGPSSAPTTATPSPTKKRRLVRGSDEPAKKAKKEFAERVLNDTKRGKKRERDEDDEYEDKRLVSDELQRAADEDIVDKKLGIASSSPAVDRPQRR